MPIATSSIVLNPQSTESFAQIAEAVLAYLNGHFQMGMWMITRRQDEDWIVLKVDREHPAITTSCTFVWSESFCSRMARGEGPNCSADSRLVPAYADAPIRNRVDSNIVAYVGVPITGVGGELFGTLCGFSSEVCKEIETHEALFRLLGQMLSAVLARELEVAASKRQLEKSRVDASRDNLTQLHNRRGMMELIESEELRCQVYGNGCYVFSIDLNGLKKTNDRFGHAAGDALIRKSAEIISRVMRAGDIAARVGGDEFIIVAVDCGVEIALCLEERLRTEFYQAGVTAGIGIAKREPNSTILRTIEIADAAMYKDKRRSKRRDVA